MANEFWHLLDIMLLISHEYVAAGDSYHEGFLDVLVNVANEAEAKGYSYLFGAEEKREIRVSQIAFCFLPLLIFWMCFVFCLPDPQSKLKFVERNK